MTSNRAVVVDTEATARLAIEEAPEPSPGPNEALVRVHTISLNPGEVRRAQTAPVGTRIGYDLAGTIEAPAADGSGPAAGDRVVGLLATQNSWAERVAVPTHALAVLPESVSFEQAATLPCAGLTALHALRKGGTLVGQRVLITGASGGVGHLAIQLARHGGATVVSLIRRDGHTAMVKESGAHEVVVDETGQRVADCGPYQLVLDSVGGQVLAAALAALAPSGTCVTFGASASRSVTFDSGNFFRTGPRTLYGLYVFAELRAQPASEGLAILANLVAEGHVRPRIEVLAPWTQIGEIAQQLLDRRYVGKAVLTLT